MVFGQITPVSQGSKEPQTNGRTCIMCGRAENVLLPGPSRATVREFGVTQLWSHTQAFLAGVLAPF